MLSKPAIDTMPASAVAALRQVEGMRERCLAVDGGPVVLRALGKCLATGAAVPDWLATAYVTRMERVSQADAICWSEPIAFGSAWPKHTRKATARRHLQQQAAVYDACWAYYIANPSAALTRKQFFAPVAREMNAGMSPAAVEVAYYRALESGRPNIARVRKAATPSNTRPQSFAFAPTSLDCFATSGHAHKVNS